MNLGGVPVCVWVAFAFTCSKITETEVKELVDVERLNFSIMPETVR